MSICVKCESRAEFDSPADLCRYHWCVWWADHAAPFETRRDRRRFINEALKRANMTPRRSRGR